MLLDEITQLSLLLIIFPQHDADKAHEFARDLLVAAKPEPDEDREKLFQEREDLNSGALIKAGTFSSS